MHEMIIEVKPTTNLRLMLDLRMRFFEQMKALAGKAVVGPSTLSGLVANVGNSISVCSFQANQECCPILSSNSCSLNASPHIVCLALTEVAKIFSLCFLDHIVIHCQYVFVPSVPS